MCSRPRVLSGRRQGCGRNETAGDCINIPVDVKHWHGAAPDEWFSHLAIEVPGVDCSNEWCEAVSEKEYAGLR